MSDLLCWQSITRCRNPLPKSKKNDLGTGDSFPEAEGLLLGTPSGGVDKPTFKADSSQTGHVRMTSEMGSGTRRIWIAVWDKTCNQRAGLDRLHSYIQI